MNQWVKKSIILASSQGYLDELFIIYPVETENKREIPIKIKYKIKKAFQNKNQINLIKELLKLPKFPIDDPYIASLRKYPDLLQKNPKTIKRISDKLFSIGLNNVLELVSKPKSPSRKFGYSFKKWLKTIGYPFLEENEFIKYNRIAFLNGGDKKLKEFASSQLKIKNLKKGIDFVLKIKDKFILGESKFLTDYGGTQNNQFRDALSITKIQKENIIGIAILDGIVWFESNAYINRAIKSLNGIALSALLLKEFIKENSSY